MKDDAPPFATIMANKAARSMQQDGSGAKKRSSSTRRCSGRHTAVQALFDSYKVRPRFNKLPGGIVVDPQALVLQKSFARFCVADIFPPDETFSFRLNESIVLSVSYFNGDKSPWNSQYLIVRIVRYDADHTSPYLIGAVEFLENLDKSMPSNISPNVILGGQTRSHPRDFSQAAAVLDQLARAVRAIEDDFAAAKLEAVRRLQALRKRQKKLGVQPVQAASELPS